MWVLVGAIGALLWLAVLGFFVALCRASGLADEQAKQRVTQRRASRPPRRATRRATRPAIERSGAHMGAQILDLGVWRAARSGRLVGSDERLLRAR
jgi:hypothetical protein